MAQGPGSEDKPSGGAMTDDPYLNLAGAIVRQAVIDSRAGNQSAYAWLLDDCPAWLDGLNLDIDPEYWRAWVRAGCPRGAPKAAELKQIKHLERRQR